MVLYFSADNCLRFKISDDWYWKTGIFESGSTRIFLVLFLLVISYLLAQWIIKSYQSKLELQKSALDKHVLANFVKSLRRRRIFFLTLKSVIYLAILICAWLFLSGVLGDIFLLFLGTLLSLFILNADYQLQKWPFIIQTLQKENFWFLRFWNNRILKMMSPSYSLDVK